MNKPAKPTAIGRVVYLNGVKGAVADIRNACSELTATVHELKQKADLIELGQVAAMLALELTTIEAAALERSEQV